MIVYALGDQVTATKALSIARWIFALRSPDPNDLRVEPDYREAFRKLDVVPQLNVLSGVSVLEPVVYKAQCKLLGTFTRS